MKTYTFVKGSLTEGFQIVEGVLHLGTRMSGGIANYLRFDRDFPPEVTDGNSVQDCVVHLIEAARPFQVLMSDDGSSDGQVLVRINTEGSYRRNAPGKWEIHHGAPEFLMEAGGRQNRVRIWTDDIIQMAPGDVIKITIQGNRDSNYVLYFEDGTLKCGLWDTWITSSIVTIAGRGEAVPRLLSVPLFTYVPHFDRPVLGVETADTAFGKAVVIGEHGPGNSRTTVPLLGKFEFVHHFPMRSPGHGDTEWINSAGLATVGDRKLLLAESQVQPEYLGLRIVPVGKWSQCPTIRRLDGDPIFVAKGKSGVREHHIPDHLWMLGVRDSLLLDCGLDAENPVFEYGDTAPRMTTYGAWFARHQS